MLVNDSKLHDVFVSYSSHDQAIVSRIADRMKSSGISLFFAPENIQAGTNFVEKIGDGIRQSQMVMVFLSQEALDSFWVKQEYAAQLVRMAEDKTARLLPILLPGVNEQQINPLLLVQHRLDFRASDLGNPDVLEESASTIIGNIRGDLPPVGTSAIGLPFVVFAMTKDEAARLQSGEAFDDISVAPIERTAFGELTKELQQYGLQDLSEYYGDRREDWRPAIAGGSSAREAISEIAHRLNQHRQVQPDASIIRPQFFSEDFLSADTAWRGRTWDTLAQLGCICVIDTVSLFHPALRAILQSSEFGSGSNISMVFIPPIDTRQLPVALVVENQIRKYMSRAFDRFETHLDFMCELCAPDVRHMKRWLFSVLPEMAQSAKGERATPEMRQAMRGIISNPTQTGQRIFGWGQ
jgi:hypothetical protein